MGVSWLLGRVRSGFVGLFQNFNRFLNNILRSHEFRKFSVTYLGISICINSSYELEKFSFSKKMIVSSQELTEIYCINESIIVSVN